MPASSSSTAEDSPEWLAPGARRHILRFVQAVAPVAEGLAKQMAERLRKRVADERQVRALLAISPAAAAAASTLDGFLRQVERRGRVLANLNVAPGRAAEALRDFDLLVERRLRGRFQPAREQLQTAVVFALYRTFNEVREMEVRRLQAQARQAEEAERRRVGRELHDEAGQSLLLLRLQLEMLEREAPAPFAPRLREARATVETTIGELRRIVAALSPAVLERLGLQAALRHLAARFQKSCPVPVRLRLAAPPDGLPIDYQEVVYRVAQECLQNVAKHSHATRVNLSLAAADKSIRLRVSDNGAGFCAETADRQPMSFGLAGMRERAELLGGVLSIRSEPGRGTAVVLQLPVGPEVALDGKNSCTDY